MESAHRRHADWIERCIGHVETEAEAKQVCGEIAAFLPVTYEPYPTGPEDYDGDGHQD